MAFVTPILRYKRRFFPLSKIKVKIIYTKNMNSAGVCKRPFCVAYNRLFPLSKISNCIIDTEIKKCHLLRALQTPRQCIPVVNGDECGDE